MKSKDICKQYEFDKYNFEFYVNKNYGIKYGISGMDIPDDQKDEIIADYTNHINQEKALKAAEEQAKQDAKLIETQENEAKKAAMSRMLITSGFTFDGYRIVKYSGYISGDDAIQVNREIKLIGGTTSSYSELGQQLTEALVKIRRQALLELKEAAYDLGCNAVIGVDFDYITLEPETAGVFGGSTTYLPYVFCVTANGNAVVIEKIEE